ncbi:MAG: HNH endonuclease [Myxococcales bacterium]|nr:HNH endonuclease [Myxococcales bacterium]
MAEVEESPSSRNIPQRMQREVRQRCGFGCVVCGMPLYEYDHLLGWANVKRHAPDEITLLCRLHHHEKGTGLLPAEQVEEANRSPYNLRTGVSKTYDFHFSGKECQVLIGGNSFGATFSADPSILLPISIDDTPLLAFSFSQGRIGLFLNLFDENNELILQIHDNQLVQSTSPWDIQMVGQNLVVREAHRKILVDIVFEPPHRIVISRGRLLRNGVELLIRPDSIVVSNNGATYTGNHIRNCPAGILIGPHSQPISTVLSLPQVPRYRHDKMIRETWISQAFAID